MIRFKPSTAFGRWLKKSGRSAADVAAELGVARAYVWMLATDRAAPSPTVAARIEELTSGDVPVSAWIPAWKKSA